MQGPHLYIGTTLSKEKSLVTTLSQEYLQYNAYWRSFGWIELQVNQPYFLDIVILQASQVKCLYINFC